MKYLVGHPQTAHLLREWAGAAGKDLKIASHYFWSTGTPMQKSQEGLLQNLLFQVFQQCVDVILVAASDRWQRDRRFHRHPDPWTITELTQTLMAALSWQSLHTRFCFFVDGLDEFSGDHWRLIRELDGIAANDTVKLCVSSRPHNVFIKAYAHEQERKMVLEELTRGDMDKYVRGMLQEDDRFQSLAISDRRAYTLVEEIRKRANGVFLWVTLPWPSAPYFEAFLMTMNTTRFRLDSMKYQASCVTSSDRYWIRSSPFTAQ